MSREKSTYRANLEELRERFPGKEQITLPDAARYLGMDVRRLRADPTFPAKAVGNKKQMVVLVNFASWLAV